MSQSRTNSSGRGASTPRFGALARGGRARALLLVTVVGVPALAAVVLLLLLLQAGPAMAEQAPARVVSDAVLMWGFAAAAASTGIGALGAAYAVSHVGAAAMGAMGERPELAGRALIFVGLAEGIAIYGLIVSIMILARLG